MARRNARGSRNVRSDDANAFIPESVDGVGRTPDDLAEYLGESFLEAVTSGNDAQEEMNDALLPEEVGGPFVETNDKDEFGDAAAAARRFDGTGRSSREARGEEPLSPEPFPTAVRGSREPVRG